MRVAGLLVILSGGCTASEPRSPTAAPASAEVEPARDTDDARDAEDRRDDAMGEPQRLAWRWRSPVAPGDSEPFPPMPTSVVNGPTTVEARALAEGGVEVVQSRRGRTQWTAAVGDAHHDAAALAWAGDVFVAHYCAIASGAVVTRLDRESGRVTWTQPLTGLGPVAHSRYKNAVQLEVVGGTVRVFGREAQGAYVEELDVADGHRMGHSRVEPALVELQWRAVDVPRGEAGFDLPQGWSMGEGEAPLLRYAPPGGEVRSIALPSSFGDCDTGAGLEHDGVLYLAHACGSSTGARLYALYVSEFAWQWQADLYALGPIGHFAYANRVALEWRGDRVLVFGDESLGRYVEAIDPERGGTLVNQSWPPDAALASPR
ncbi:MAG: hypothetical protein ACE37F_32210 [Nannocystaceae bacterium]|nr:hypothetical protein [bacterium]